MKPEQPPRSARVALLGAMFLMATSAIGPGFITQTTQFTAQLGAAFAFAILVSVLVDVAIQLNVWRVIGVSGLRAPELGNRVAPGLGHALALTVALGGLVFNVGNVAGKSLTTTLTVWVLTPAALAAVNVNECVPMSSLTGV